MREEVRGGKFSALAEREVFRDVSARTALHPSHLKDEPRQGFLSVPFFERERPLFGYRFSSGDEGLFCDTIFPKKPSCPFARKRCAIQALRYLKLLPSGAKRHLSKSCRYRNRKIYLRLLEYRFLREKPLLSCVLRRAVTGFFKRTIFGVGARKRIQQSASQ